MIYKALSLKQPWANLIMNRRKTIETRVWKTKYRGDIVICSSLRPEKDIYPFISRDPLGYALGIVELYDIQDMLPEHEARALCTTYPNAQAWFLRNVRQFKNPFPIKGQLGLFDIEIKEELQYV